MKFPKHITGKTIAGLRHQKPSKFDDTGFLRLDFTDGSHCTFRAFYDEFTGESLDEYPTRIQALDPAREDEFDLLDIGI